MDVLQKFKKLDLVNEKYFLDYLRFLELRNIKQTTINTKFWKIYGFLIWSEFRDARTATPADLENFYLHRRRTRSPITAFGDIQELILFFKWLLPDKVLVTFKPQKPRNDIPPEKVLQSDNVIELLKMCENQRDRALVALVWDSAARISELLDTNIGHVQFDQYGAIISVSGKTGRRNIRLIDCVGDLQAWINIHPMKTDPNAPLFTTSRRRGSVSVTRLTVRRAQNILSRLGDLAGCPKDTNPHAFRHGRLTVRGQQLTESQLREYAGWSKGSSMAQVYVHLSSRDIDDKILAIHGIKQEDNPTRDPMASLICPRCRFPNPPDMMYCGRCSMALSEDALREITAMKTHREDPVDMSEYSEWLKTREK